MSGLLGSNALNAHLDPIHSYKFRQSSDFWYLTGFDEPDAAVILEKRSSSPRGYYMRMFSMGTDPAKEKWDGARTCQEDIVQYFGADEADPISVFPSVLRSLTSTASHVYFDLPSGSKRPRAVSPKSLLKVRIYSCSRLQPYRRGCMVQCLSPSGGMLRTKHDKLLDSLDNLKPKPLAPEVDRLRSIKSKYEQDVMRQAADISARAHNKVSITTALSCPLFLSVMPQTMRFTDPGMPEYAVSAHFEYLCARDGAQRPAYVPVVASGYVSP